MNRVLLCLVALAPSTLLPGGLALARRPRPAPCRGGRFLVLQGEQLVGDATPQTGALVLTDVGPRLSLGTACGPVRAKRVVTRKGTRIAAVFRGCRGIKGRLRLHAAFSADCHTLAGDIVARRARLHRPFTATRSSCGDRVFDPLNGEEQCDGGLGCPAGTLCGPRCACTATGGPPTTTSTTSTTLPAPTSAVSGAVLAADGTRLRGVTVSIAGTSVSQPSDGRGRFHLTGVPTGPQTLLIDGSTADDPRTFPPLAFPIHVVEGLDAGLPRPIYLPPLDMATATTLALDGDGRTVAEHVIRSTITAPDGTPGMILRVPRGTHVTFTSGTPRAITISPVPTNKVPMALADGKGSLSYFTVQPHDVRFDPPASVSYANVAGLPPGLIVQMMSFDHDAGRYVSRGPGQVSADGRTIDSLPGSGLTEGGWHAPGFDVEPTNATGMMDDCGRGGVLHRAIALMHQADGDMDNSLEALGEAERLNAEGLVDLFLDQLRDLMKKAVEEEAAAGEAVTLGEAVGELASGLAEVALAAQGLADEVVNVLEIQEQLDIADEHFKHFQEHADQAIDLLHMLNECEAKTAAKAEAAAALMSDPSLRGQQGTLAGEDAALAGAAADLAADKASVDELETKLNQLLAAAGPAPSVRPAVALSGDQLQVLAAAEALTQQLGASFAQARAVLAAANAAAVTVAAREQQFLTAFAAVFQGSSSTVNGVANAPTDVGTIDALTGVAGVAVVASGVTGFTDAAGRFTLFGVPGVVVDRATGARTPLPVTVEADDAALSGLRPDTDGDGMPDDWERMNGLDPNDPTDALRDDDGDGLTNLQEYASGGNPHSRDTDGDGVDDLAQVEAGRMAMAPPRPPGLRLFTLSPNRGGVGQRVTLAGTGFAPVAGDDSVRFGDVPAEVLDASPTALTVLVPPGARSGGVTVTAGGATSNAVDFLVLLPPAPIAPVPQGFVPLPGFANAVDVAGDTAFVAAGAAGLVTVDVHDRQHPAVAATLGLPGNAEDVKVVGQRAYVAAGAAGLAIADVSDPARPALLGQTALRGEARDVAVAGSLAVLAEGTAGLETVDITDPSSPRVLGSVALPGPAKGVALAGTLAIVADGAAGVQVVDVHSPASPVIAGAVATPGDARDLAVDEGIAYVAAYDGSLVVVDVARPDAPAVLAATPADVGGFLTGVAVPALADLRLAFGADVRFVNGVPIVNVTAPGAPAPQAFLDFGMLRDDNGTAVAADASFVYLTAAQGIVDKGTSGDTRLYIGRYRLPADTGGNPPDAVITSPPPGATVVPGELVPFAVAATDDVAVARVDLTVGGQTILGDATAPYETTFAAPQTPGTVALGAVATDFGGNVGRAGTIRVTVIPDPGTTVTGTVEDERATPLAGALVATAGGRSGATGADGRFAIDGVPTAALALDASASWTATDGSLLVGSSAPAARVRGGITDVGTIVVRGTFDLSADFSVTSNPSGVWRYGAATSPGSISLFAKGESANGFGFWHLAPGIPEALAQAFGSPAMVKNLLNTPSRAPGGGVLFPPGQVAFYPGPNGELAVIRFTAPAAGDYALAAMFSGGDLATTNVHVFTGTTELFAGPINGFGDQQSFMTARRLAAGDTVDLAVDPAGNFFSDATFVDATLVVEADTAFLGPSSYLSTADGPFNRSGLGTTFFLADFEHGALDTPGVTASAGGVQGPGPDTDSVDADDGTLDGSGHAGHDFLVPDGAAGVTFTFDASVLGTLPTRVGVVWTNGAGATTFEAFDAHGASLGTIGPTTLAPPAALGTAGAARFLGVTHAGGVSAITIRNGGGSLQLDHLQYGR